MQAGLLTERIGLYRLVEERGGSGGVTARLERYAEPRAWVRSFRGATVNDGGEVFATVTRTVTIREVAGLSTDDRVELFGQMYRVVSLDRNRKDRTVTMVLELIND